MSHQGAARKEDVEVINAEEVDADDVTDCEETEQHRRRPGQRRATVAPMVNQTKAAGGCLPGFS